MGRLRRMLAVPAATGALAVGLVLAAAAPAGAAPSNKNTETIQATCDGTTITITGVRKDNETADLVSAGPIVGGGSVKVPSLTVFEPGTTNAIFTATSNYGGPTNATCTGTFSEGGETFDFTVQAHLVGV
jgi:hypothetical protein